MFACLLVVVLEDPDKGVWGGPQTNTRDDGRVALAFGHIILVLIMARTFPGILEHISNDTGCILKSLTLKMENALFFPT